MTLIKHPICSAAQHAENFRNIMDKKASHRRDKTYHQTAYQKRVLENTRQHEKTHQQTDSKKRRINYDKEC